MINVIGLGYIGLPTALMMASHGVEVTVQTTIKSLSQLLMLEKQLLKKSVLTNYLRMLLRQELNLQLNIR